MSELKSKPGITALLLGSAQDGGLPQLGCNCPNCAAAKASPNTHAQLAVSMALVDTSSQRFWLLDCGPDIKAQYDAACLLAGPEATLAGVLITHLHMGHYTGLLQMGKEALDVKGLKVYGTASVLNFFAVNQPWKGMVAHGTFDLCEVTPDTPVLLTDQLSATPWLVPHRAELSDTVAWCVRGPERRLLFLPDIDSWDAWERDLCGVVASVDIALLDACFYSHAELQHRDMRAIPHPVVLDTMSRLALQPGLARRTVLVHLNHSNPLWSKDGAQRREVEALGMRVGAAGMQWQL